MKPGNLRALRATDISPEIVLQSLENRLSDIGDIYVVVFTKEGEPEIYASGDLTRLPSGALILQDTALSYARGEFQQEK